MYCCVSVCRTQMVHWPVLNDEHVIFVVYCTILFNGFHTINETVKLPYLTFGVGGYRPPSAEAITGLAQCAFGKNLLSSNISSTCPHNMVNFGPRAAEIGPVVWGTPANFNGFRILAALLHGTLVVGISQTLRRWTEGATYILQGGHHVGHWTTFLVVLMLVMI